MSGQPFAPGEGERHTEDLARSLFDAEYYCSQLPPGTQPHDPWEHFLSLGHRGGFEPSPYFSSDYFLRQFTGPARRSAWEEFCALLGAAGDGVAAHPLFDADFYRTENPEIGDDHAWLHWVLHGDRDGRSPSRLFDAGYYRTTHQPLDGRNPFRHYVTCGRFRGYRAAPSPVLAADSARAFDAALGDRPIVVVGNDAQLAGGPMHAEMVVRGLRHRGFAPVVVLERGGPLLARFERLAPTFILRDGWDWPAMVRVIPRATPVIANTVATAHRLTWLPGESPATLLVHEYPGEIERLGFTATVHETLGRGVRHGFVLPAARDAFAAAFGLACDDSRLEVLGSAPYEDRPEPVHYARARAALGVDERPIVAGAAYADHRKGFDRFLDVAAEIHARRPDIRVVWFGALGPWAEELVHAAPTDGLHLELPGAVTPLHAWLAQCSALLVTSRSDTGPATVMYAAQEGVPTVAFDGDIGALDYIRQVGAVVPDGDITGYAEAAIAMTRPEPARTSRMRLLLTQFEPDAYFERLVRTPAPGEPL